METVTPMFTLAEMFTTMRTVITSSPEIVTITLLGLGLGMLGWLLKRIKGRKK